MEDNKLKESFLKNWERFMTELKGNLISYSDKQFLSYSGAVQVLSDTLFEWKSDSNLIGRWLNSIKKDDYERYIKISDILFKSVAFETLEINYEKYIEYLPYLPYGISMLALGTTFVLDKSIWWKLLAVALPPILLKTSMQNMQNELKRQSAKKMIPVYLEQLDKYKESILACLD